MPPSNSLPPPEPPDFEATSASPSPAQMPPDPPDNGGAFPWFWLGTFIGTALSAAGLGLAAWAWIFIHEDLSPLLAKVLTESLERPLALGEVEQVTWNSLRVGPSQLGASAKDPTTVDADTVIVKFDLLETLFTSKLGLDLIIEEAEGYLEQDPEKGWLNFEIPEQKDEDKDERFKVRLDNIQVRDSQLTLMPLPAVAAKPQPILLDSVRAEVEFDEVIIQTKETRRTRLEITGSPEKGGEITLKGEVQPVAAKTEAEAKRAAKLEADAPKDQNKDLEASVNDDEPKIEYATNLTIQADKAPLSDILSFTLSTIDLATDQVTVPAGKVSGTLDLGFEPNQPIDYSGVVSLDKAEVETNILPLPFKQITGQAQIKGNQWTIDQLRAEYGAIAATAKGLIDFDKGYDLALVTKDVTVKEFTETVDLELPVPATGRFDAVAAVTGPIDKPEFSGTATAISALDVDKLTFTSASTDFLLQGQQLSLTDIAATPNTGGSLRGDGQVWLGQGSPFTFQIAARSLPAAEIAKLYGLQTRFKLGLVAADATVVGGSQGVTTTVNWDAPTAQYPGSGTLEIQGNAIAFRETNLQIGGGTVTGSGNWIEGNWTGDLNLQNVQLSTFSETLQGDVSGQVQLNGNTANSTLGAIQGKGNVAFSAGLAAFNPQLASLRDHLTAQVAWNGQQLQIIQANTDRATASGTLTPLLSSDKKGFEGLESLNLNVVAQDYGLNEIPFVTLPTALDLAGRANFAGSITGNPTAPTISGDVQVANLIANRLPFNPLLGGTVDYSASNGLNLNLAGATDKIALNIGPATLSQGSPSAANDLNFDIGWRSAFASGQTQGELLKVTAGNFPLSVLNFPPQGAGDIGQLRGTLTAANLDVNLNRQTVDGDIVIDQLGLGYIGAGQLVGQVRYADRLATLTNGELTLNDSRYSLNGRIALNGPVPVYSANLETQAGNIQNLLTALSIYRLEDFRRGLTPPEWIANPPSESMLDSILATTPTGRADAALIDQLRRIAEIQALQADAEIAAANQPLPPIQALNGPFAGNLQLNGSGSDFELDFDLAGQDWTWGEVYSAQEVLAKGTLTPNVLTLEPVRFASNIPVPKELEVSQPDAENGTGSAIAPSPTATDAPALSTAALENSAAEGNGQTENLPENPLETKSAIAAVNLAGQIVFGRNTQLTSNLQATAQNLNIDTLSKVLALPFEIEGYANATSTLGGTLANPQLRGLATLEAATINQTPIQSADAQFLYQNARLSLASKLIATTPEQPLTLSAQIPYAFNFMETQPENKNIDVEIKVQDEGLALLNIFTQQVAWESGKGQVQLNVGGTLLDPSISGVASLDEAVINAKILSEPLTNVSGRATFAGEQIIIETLQGQFSDGQLTAAGIFPLLYPVLSGAQISALAAAAPSEETADSLFPQPLDPSRPLTVNFKDIDLNFQNLYQGGVNGQVLVGGSALLGGPQIGGQVILSNGQIRLPDGNSSATNGSGSGSANNPATESTILASAPAAAPSDSGIPTNFRDLRLTLGRSVRIVQGNLLNFNADGTLILNGPPTDLRPNGIISLRSGGINLYTTLFRLRGRNNTAKFTPESGLNNPFLDVSLRASVSEVNRPAPIASTPFATSEIADTANNGFANTGSLSTLRVQADVQGPANAIFENLELSSSPARREDELIALIGGGFVNAIESTVGSLSGGGDSFEGLINLVGGTVLTRIQDLVGSALSLSEFNLVPVTSANRGSSTGDDRDNRLDVAASIGFDLTEATSLSVTKILTDSTNPEIGVNYRLTDALTVRGTTNFDDINQFLLEYELRF